MATTGQQLLEAAYAGSVSNDPGKLATDGELLSLADRVVQALFAIAATAAPDRFQSKTAWALTGSPARIAISPDLIDIRRVQNAGGKKVTIIPIEEIDRGWHLAPCVYREGSAIVTRGQTGDPGTGDSLTAWVLDAPATLSALDSTLDPRYPVRGIELIVIFLKMYLATKDKGRDPQEFAALTAERNMHVEMFIKTTGLSTTALNSPHGGLIIQRLDSLLAGFSGQGAAA